MRNHPLFGHLFSLNIYKQGLVVGPLPLFIKQMSHTPTLGENLRDFSKKKPMHKSKVKKKQKKWVTSILMTHWPWNIDTKQLKS
jgi:hypothetical protein